MTPYKHALRTDFWRRHVTPKKGCLIGFALLILLTPSVLFAQITNICFPNPIGVPGMGSQAPNWAAGGPTPQRTELDDPRWNGSMRFSFDQQDDANVGGPDVSEATVRGLMKNGLLYISYEVLVDPGGPSADFDAIYFGISPRTTTSTDNAYLARLELNTASTSLVAAMSVAEITWFSRPMNASAHWTPLGPSAPAAISNAAVWTTVDTWAISFVVDLSAVPVTQPLKTFYGINTQFTAFTFAQHSLPAVGTFTIDGSTSPQPGLATILPADWPDTWLGNSSLSHCPEGVSIASSQIGSTNANASTIVKGANNTFFANPTYSALYSALSANRVKARFRLANWGSQVGETDAPWSEVADGVNVFVGDGGGIEGTCYATPAEATANGGKVCPNPDTDSIITHQCMLVNLSGTGTSSVNFTRSSAYRNMNFVSSSVFTRNAEISVAGLKPIRGKSGRDVYVYVRTKNMPKKVKRPYKLQLREMAKLSAKVNRKPRIDKGFWKREMKLFKAKTKKGAKTALLKQKSAKQKPAKQKSAKLIEPTPSIERVIAGQAPFATDTLHTHYEKITKVWPTYEVHVYHETGEIRKISGKNMKRVRAQLPFGYHVTHNTSFYGWDYELHGISGSVVEQIGRNLYRMHVPNGGVARLKTSISSLEKSDIIRKEVKPIKKPIKKTIQPIKKENPKMKTLKRKAKPTSQFEPFPSEHDDTRSSELTPDEIAEICSDRAVAGFGTTRLRGAHVWMAAGFILMIMGFLVIRRRKR